LLSGVIVVESMDALSALLAGPHGMNLSAVLDGYALVARDGTALDRDGALRGGTTQSDNSASLLGRKRAITELQTQVATAETEFAAAEGAVNAQAESLEMAQARLASLRAEFQSAEIESAKLDRDVQQLSRSLKELESSKERFPHAPVVDAEVTKDARDVASAFLEQLHEHVLERDLVMRARDAEADRRLQRAGQMRIELLEQLAQIPRDHAGTLYH
jgi:chromosome segregation ATPase